MATRADKPVHQPSEKHTLDEVLKSLQDLVRNDFDSPPAPAGRKARVKEPARRHADDEHFGTTEAIGELMASLAALTGDETPATPVTPATEPEDSPEALPLIDVDELQDTSDRLRFEPAPEPDVPPPPASSRVEAAPAAPESPVEAEPFATTITVEPEAPGTPAGSPAAEPALEPEIIDIEAAPPVAELAESASGETDAESIEFGEPAPQTDDAGDAAEADAPANPVAAEAAQDSLMPVADFEAPSMDLETLSFDALETGDAARPDDPLLSVSDLEAPSIELDSLPPLHLDVSDAQPDSPLIPATDFEAPSLEIDALSLEPEAPSPPPPASSTAAAGDPGTATPARPAAGETGRRDKPPAGGIGLADTDQPLAVALTPKTFQSRPAPTVASKPNEPAGAAGGSKPAEARKPLELVPDNVSLDTTSAPTTPAAAAAPGVAKAAPPAPRPAVARPDAPQANRTAAKAAAPNRVSLPTPAVIKQSTKAGKPKAAAPVTKPRGEQAETKPARFRPDNTGVRSGAVPRPSGMPKAAASKADARSSGARDAAPVSAVTASTPPGTAHGKAAQPGAAPSGTIPPGGLQQDLPLATSAPTRDFAATVPIEPYFVERPAPAAKPPAAATAASSPPRTAAAAPSGSSRPAKPVAAASAAVSPAGTQPGAAKPADRTPGQTKPAETGPAAATKPADTGPLPPAATAAAPATTLQAAITAAALSADAVNVNWDDIPVLKDAVELEAAKGGPVDAARARKVAIQVAARLNVELRRAGKRSLNSAVVTRLARLIHEELAPSRANVDNNKVKKS